MAPKKSNGVEEGEQAKAAAAAEPTRRVTRASAAAARRQTRSSTQGSSSSASPKPAVPKKRAAASARASKKKVKSEAVKSEEEGDKAEAEEGNEEGEAAEDDGGGGGANTKNIVIERCTQCNSFKTRADQVKASLEALPGITVTINPVRPRRGCFEIREEGGETFISLLNMKRPFKPMKDLNMQEVIDNIIQQISNE